MKREHGVFHSMYSTPAGDICLALSAPSRQSLCHGTTFQIDVPGTALGSAQEIHAQIE